MSSAIHSNQADPNREQTTLADLVYADAGRSAATEREWVGLVQRIAQKDQTALHALYERVNRIVFTLVLRITGNQATAEELTVDVFHDVWRRAPTYDPVNGSVVGWVMNQARSRAIDRLRFEQRKKRVGDGIEAAPPAHADDPHAHLDVKESRRAVRDALAVLTMEERRAIETAFFAELTYAEVAARLHQPIGTVKTRIRSGLTKLRQALGQQARNA
jgi:RNA polymerase sigma-70 factor (ECF subfamily)